MCHQSDLQLTVSDVAVCMLQALKQYVRRVYHPFLSADYAVNRGQPLAINFLSSFADNAPEVNLGEVDDDVISRRNMQGKGPFAHQFRVEVSDKKTGKAIAITAFLLAAVVLCLSCTVRHDATSLRQPVLTCRGSCYDCPGA